MVKGGKSLATVLSRIDTHPRKTVMIGIVTSATGGGVMLIAAPLTALSASLLATGLTVVKCGIIGGILALVCAVSSKDTPVSDLFKGAGLLSLSGLATMAAGGILGCIAGLCVFAGGALIGAGTVTLAVLIARQSYLRLQGRRRPIAMKNLEQEFKPLRLGHPEGMHEPFPN